MQPQENEPADEPVIPISPLVEWLNHHAAAADQEAFDLELIAHDIVPGPTTPAGKTQLERRVGGLAVKQELLEDFKAVLMVESADNAGKLHDLLAGDTTTNED